MNARADITLDDPAERRARHLALCQEMAQLAMELARAAQREAMKDLTAPIEHRMPGMAPEPTCRTEDPGEFFTRLCRCARQAILLEARVAAGNFARPPALPTALHTPPANRPEPASPTHPRAQGGHEPHERLEDDLAGEAARSPEEILSGICDELNDIVDLGQAPDRPYSLFVDTPRQGPLATQPHRVPYKRPPPKPG